MAQRLSTAHSAQPTRPAGRLVRGLSHYLRFIIASIFIVIGILGVILPVLPGTVWFIIASLIIGRRSLLLRRLSVAGKRMLRRWTKHRNGFVRWIGRWSVEMQCDTSRRLRRINGWIDRQVDGLRRRFVRA